MKKLSLLFFAILSLSVLSWCGKKIDDTVISTGTVQWFTTSYVVGNSPVFQKALYGTVIADSIKTIVANKWGILDYIDCQPGETVYKDTIIAKIQANPDDITYQNTQTQLDVLQRQYDNLASVYTLTEETLFSQKWIFEDQYANNIRLLDDMQDSLYSSTGTALSQLKTQRTNLLLAQQTLEHQMDAADTSRETQLAGITNQILTLKQNVATLSNSLEGEILYAGVDGVVKMRSIGEENKVVPGTLLCQITPTTPWNLSLQIFSYQQLSLWTKVHVTDEQWKKLGMLILTYEYPYKDPATQNYIYEVPVITSFFKEWQKVLVVVPQSVDDNQLWVPLQYISPRLEGNLVRRKAGTAIENIYVTLWDINDMYVQVLSGLHVGDEIVQ
ncbi:MAG: hypothetical protein ACD_80C00147G0014 [uncultured bacterium (gcode 4)]|uniref:Uncharacterized protein n=1 Tax=uncultured bacterium (gcode 4) TaxID=1234023 RepID=K1X419_9BACT|nr:MAG: hypothetical protein ACD_80C00147G0014 [uncultured bacterium (gcode 4)]